MLKPYLGQAKKIILIILVGFLVYSSALFVGFLWDDFGLVTNNPLIKQAKFFPQVFANGIFAGEEKSKNFYRPVQSLSYMFDFFIWQDNPAGYHFTNIILHIAATIALFFFFSALFKNEKIAFLSSLFFLIHPVNVEVVTYISGRADSLVLLFLLASFISYFHFRDSQSNRFLFLSGFSFLLALLAKELALAGILIFPLIDWLAERKIRIQFYALFIVLSFLVIICRFFVLGQLHLKSEFAFFPRLFTFLVNILEYLRILFFPVNLHMSYTSKVFTTLNFFILARFVGSLAFFWLIYRILKKKKVFFFCLGWFFIFLIPQSGLLPINAFFAEHFIYLSQYSLFFVILLAVFEIFKSKKMVFYWLFIICSLLLSAVTCSYTQVWTDPIKFYKRIISLSPNSFAAYNNLGAELEKRGLMEPARRSYLKALSINPNDVIAYNNLGKSYLKEGKFEKAIKLFKQAIEKDSHQAVLYYNSGIAYKLSGDLSASADEYEKAFQMAKKLIPWDSSVYLELALLYRNTGRGQEAMQELQKAISIDPKDPLLHLNLGALYAEQNFPARAIDEYMIALQLDPKLPAIYNNLGTVYAKTGNLKSALCCLLGALELDNNYHEARFNLGLLYSQMGLSLKAKEQFDQIPNSVEFYPAVRKELKKISLQKDPKKH